MPDRSASSPRIWLAPLSLLAGVCLAVLVLTLAIDGARVGDPAHAIRLLLRPDPAAAASTLANAGEIVAAVLAIALTVVAIVVELASNRYTHRVTELFVSEPVNFAVMGLFVVTALQSMWVTMTFEPTAASGFVPYTSIGVTMALLTACLLVLLPYFNFVFAYLNPIQIVNRIQKHTVDAIRSRAAHADVRGAQEEAVRGVEQLGDVALNAMEHRDKGISMAAADALRDLLQQYRDARPALPDAWYRVEGALAHNPDFVSMDRHVLEEITARRIWFEMKVLRQYQMVYGEALHRMRDVCYVIAINTRLAAEQAATDGDRELVGLAIKFFNTFLRATINAKDVRTAYNVCHQYRTLARGLLAEGDGSQSIEIARCFRHYGLLAYAANLPFVLETVAYDLCTLNEHAHETHSPAADALLRIFLQVDRQSEGAVQEASLRGVRKAQVKLATYFLAKADEARARRVFEDMRDEDPRRLASIRDELFGVHSPEYWEIIDRGENFDYLPPQRRAQLDVFFGWFPGLPPVQPSPSLRPPTA